MKTCIECAECVFNFSMSRLVYDILYCKLGLLPSPHTRMDTLIGGRGEINHDGLSIMLSVAEVCPEFKERHKSE